MIRERLLAALGAAVITVAAGIAAIPAAHADPLDNIRGAVNGARGQSTCAPLAYSGQLEGAAQAWVRDAMALDDIHRSFSLVQTDYPGEILATQIASGDPTQKATNALIGGATGGIKDCNATEYGVGMARDDVIDKSFVAVVLGKQKAVEAPPQPVQCPPNSVKDTVVPPEQCQAKPKVLINCPEGSPTPQVEEGQQCAAIPAQTNKIQAAFGEPGLTSVDFTVTNTSTLNAVCDYVSTTNSLNPLVPKKTTRTINVDAGQSTTTTFDGAPTLSTFNVTLACRDASGKQKEPLGNVTTSLQW
jgi:hypothetical protein